MEVKDIVLKKLDGLVEDETMIDMAIDEAEMIIRNFCHFHKIIDNNPEPIHEGLKHTWANIAFLLARKQYYSTADPETVTTATGDVQSLKIGDTTITYATNSAQNPKPTTWDDTAVTALVMDVNNQLINYRRIKWDAN